MGAYTESVQQGDPIGVASAIAQASEPRALAAVEACELAQVVEGQGAQTVMFGIVEEAGQRLARRLVSLACACRFISGDRVDRPGFESALRRVGAAHACSCRPPAGCLEPRRAARRIAVSGR